MRIAFAILAHNFPRQIGEFARVLCSQGDLVVIHYDRNSPEPEYRLLEEYLRAQENVVFAERVCCGWGEFSLVQATLNCLNQVRQAPSAVNYVYLLSGYDLPVKPISQLREFLDQSSGQEFIESFPIAETRWLVGGCQEERFLYRFPFNKRRHRRLFRAFLLLQRWLGLRKRVPPGLELCLGSQFWCLTWPSCLAILHFCESRPDVVAFFRSAWIPDESFFQSLIRSIAPPNSIETCTPTHYEFDSFGRPLDFSDASPADLEQIAAYFVRKVRPDAVYLRSHFYHRSIKLER